MTGAPDWWQRPRVVQVVIDNPSWMLPFGEALVEEVNAAGDHARLVRDYGDVGEGAVAFYLSCVNITPPVVMARSRRNLVVHASDLPHGRGFSPLTWKVLEGLNDLPVCLFEAVEAVDAGPVIYLDEIHFEGHELIGEMRDLLGAKSNEMCLRFLNEETPPDGIPQQGEGSIYPRRRPKDSELDPHKSIAEQFALLRVVDNDNYPAFFTWQGHRYKLAVEKLPDDDT